MRALAAIAAGLIGLAAIVLPGVPAAAQDPDTVRVLHVTLDSLHPSEVGERTPTLLELQSQGTWYEQARGVMASETLPNHVAMGTGTYPGRNGIPGNSGRVAPGDTTLAEPDLGDPTHLQADSFVDAIEQTCPDLRTVTVLSKAYVHRVFLDDPVDSRFPQEQFNIPVSDHAPDTATVGYIEQELLAADPPDYVFANLGDIDRAGHIDETGFADVSALRQGVITQTDTLLAGMVETLKAQGLWESTVLVLSSDHSMDYTDAADAGTYVDLAGALEADPRTAGRFFVGENGGAGLVYLLDPDAEDADELLVAAREVLAGLDGVLEALYREPNPLDPGGDLAAVHPDWNLHGTDRAGELFVHVEPGTKVSTPLAEGPSNPLPGNHGHAATTHVTMLVTGGWEGLAEPQSIAPSDPEAVDTVTYDDTAALPEQAEQVDLAPTFGWLLGVPDPGEARPQWQGRVLDEAFARQPEASCVASAAPTPSPSPTPTRTEAAPETAGDQDPAAAPVTPVTGGGAARAVLGLLGMAVAGAGRSRRR